MRVLLLGEFSSFHRYLKEGLQKLDNVEVVLAANGDGWKKIPGCDMQLFDESRKGYISSCYEKIIKSQITARKFKGFDVVQVINPRIYPTRINQHIIDKIIKNNRCISLSACGGGFANVKAYNEGLYDYYPYNYDKYSLELYDENTREGRLNIKNALNLEKRTDVIIPILYEYTLGHIGNVVKPIPAPINTDTIKYNENIIKDKIVFFHGLNGEARKGTPFIRKALEQLQEEYPDEIEVIIDGHMPFDKYLEVISRTNVVVDQCCTYGYGINACIAMAQGKIVMAPCRKETLEAFGIDGSPIIHIKPDVDQIYSQLVYIVKNKEKIKNMGCESRKYVEEYHNYIKVAKQYINVWKSTLKL